MSSRTKASLTDLVDGLRATRPSSATKTGTTIRDIPQSISVTPLRVFDDLGGTSVERIDVFKGPATRLYGRGNPGGTVNIVSKKPPTRPLHPRCKPHHFTVSLTLTL
jgi:outer membrane receptor protein involved in Fe transport